MQSSAKSDRLKDSKFKKCENVTDMLKHYMTPLKDFINLTLLNFRNQNLAAHPKCPEQEVSC